MAEIEISIMSRQALAKPLPDFDSFCRQVRSWTLRRNSIGGKVNWQFRSSDARMKLAKLYPPYSLIPCRIKYYSPNLNLIERLWKFVKGELRSRYYDDFSIFQQRIDSIIDSTSNRNKDKISRLIGQKVQLFDGLLSLCPNTFAANRQPVAKTAV